ncbi:PAS domain-containing hybrid sensor histidine kinase/response regulator [Nannocystis radixulma]|uniref:histidine kinase n=1 Tax=Nannocystis radixulma TaxID=2995305 RepID=A0ABT5BNT9_9BACT|nr:PAS domain-containing hybrid sensor histidine kinase/response regulator [Nannocystis radixulma]MDC0674601.1 ATP-binding protein [Nannocystis radixulma]
MPESEGEACTAHDFAALLDSLPGMVYRCRADRAWTLDYVSAGALELTGFRPDELLASERRAYAELIVPMDRRAVEAAVESAVAAGQSFTLEYRIRDRAGRTKQVWERGRLIRGEGKSAVLEGFITDISPLRRAEHDVRERLKELELLYEVSSIAGDESTLDEALWQIADRIPRGYSYPPEVAARIQLGNRLYTSPRFASDPCSQSAPINVEGRAVGVVEVCRIVDSDVPRERYFLREEQEMLHVVAGRVGALAERARIVDALRASERHARDLYERLPIATVVWQQRGDSFVLVDHNRAAFTLSDGRVPGWIGRSLDQLLPDRPDLAEALRTCAGSEAPSRREIELAGIGGLPSIYVVSLGFVPPDLVLAHVLDVTRERHLERRFQEAQKMEVLGRMAAGVAHDFNNLLTVILSYTGMLEQSVAASRASGSEVADLEEIRKASERAAALTQQLLSFSRRDVVAPEIMDISAKTRELRGMLVRLLGEDRLLTCSLAGAPCPVRMGPGQLDQILVNLVINARDATRAGGRVVIATARLEAGDDDGVHIDLPPGPRVVLTVRDDGSGMDEVTRARIFEPFFTTKPPGLGTGMGLSIVYGIVRQAGGAIVVDSHLGAGTTFRIYFPREEEVAPRRPSVAPAPQLRPPGGETVLLVEDSEQVRRLVLRVLAAAGYHVLTAADAAEALLLCDRNGGAIDLLVTDLVMPWTTGASLAHRVSSRCPGVRVLFMSGSPERAMQAAAELDATASFLAKPFTGEALVGLVRRILDGEPAAS